MKNWIRQGILGISLVTSSLFIISTSQAAEPVAIVINDTQIEHALSPVMKNDSVWVPLRLLEAILSASKVEWAAATQTATLIFGNTTLHIQAGVNELEVIEGSTARSVTVSQTAQLIDGRLLLPLRAVAELLNAEVHWNGKERQVEITLDPQGNAEISQSQPAVPIPGPQGPQGQKGEPGEPGKQGQPGHDGAAGPAGSQGPAGKDGTAGPAGSQGPAGKDGTAGPAGSQGPAGKDGTAGPAGSQGPAGKDGAAGPAGSQGPAGKDGAAGPAGSQGPAGPQGPQGPQGLSGQDGAGLQGIVAFDPSLAPTYDVNQVVTYQGSTYLVIIAPPTGTPGMSPDYMLLAAAGLNGGHQTTSFSASSTQQNLSSLVPISDWVVNPNSTLNISNGVFTAPNTGYYAVNATLNYKLFSPLSISLGSADNPEFAIYRNNSPVIHGKLPILNVNVALVLTMRAVLEQATVNMSGHLYMDAGDTLDLRYNANNMNIPLLLESGSHWSITSLGGN